MLRANLMPGQKKKKGFNLKSPDRMLLLVVVTILLFLAGTYIYTLYKEKIANTNLTTLIQEEMGYATEKTLYEDNKALAQKTYDLEKYLDTGLTAQISGNSILSNISKYMLPDTYLDKITFDISTAGLVMDFRSASFESLTVLFGHLLVDAAIKDVKIGSYALAAGTTLDAKMQITATWVIAKKAATVPTPTGTNPGVTPPVANPGSATIVTNPDGSTTTTNPDGTITITNLDGTSTTTNPDGTPAGTTTITSGGTP
jgi:hypothetical protein